jgi:hypothetical protein
MFKRSQFNHVDLCAAVSANAKSDCPGRHGNRSRSKASRPLQISAVRQTDHGGPGDYFIYLREANPPSDKRQRYYSVFFDNDIPKAPDWTKDPRSSLRRNSRSSCSFEMMKRAAPSRRPAATSVRRGDVTDRGWKRQFDDPIPLPRGRQLVTLEDAAVYIMKLPKAEQNIEEWQTAVGCLIGAAEGRDFMMPARIGVLRALNRNVERTFTDRKDSHWGKRKLKRD